LAADVEVSLVQPSTWKGAHDLASYGFWECSPFSWWKRWSRVAGVAVIATPYTKEGLAVWAGCTRKVILSTGSGSFGLPFWASTTASYSTASLMVGVASTASSSSEILVTGIAGLVAGYPCRWRLANTCRSVRKRTQNAPTLEGSDRNSRQIGRLKYRNSPQSMSAEASRRFSSSSLIFRKSGYRSCLSAR
jgi:hypothetical protein